MKRLVLVLAALLLFSMPVLPVTAEEVTGLCFSEDIVWKGTKTVLETPATFEAWVKFPQNTSGRGGVILSTYGDNSTESITFEVFSGGAPRLYWVERDGAKFDWRFENVNLYTGNWEHVSIVRDGQAGTVSCYLNGELCQTLSADTSTGALAWIPFCLGGDHRDPNEQYCKGQIRTAAIYSTVRTAQEIKADMQQPGDDGLLLHYELDGTQTDRIADLSGNGYDLIASTRWFTQKEPVTDYAYSFVVVGDTQKVAYNDPHMLGYLYKYIVDNAQAKNTKFVIGLGDMTDKSSAEEWSVVQKGLAMLDGVVPYSFVRGNHDTIATFNAAFPISNYADVIGGSCADNMLNTYYTFEVGRVKYLVLCLDYGASDSVLEWANSVVEANPDRNVIVATHAYMFRNGTTLDANELYAPSTHGGFNDGDHMWDKLIKKHGNIVLVLSGHDPNAQVVLSQVPGEKGNIVTQLLVDGQTVDLKEGSCGFVTTLYFSEDGRDVTVEHYATLKQKFFLTENQFSFTLDVVEPAEEVVETIQPSVDSQSDEMLYALIGASVLVIAVAAAMVIILKKKK